MEYTVYEGDIYGKAGQPDHAMLLRIHPICAGNQIYDTSFLRLTKATAATIRESACYTGGLASRKRKKTKRSQSKHRNNVASLQFATLRHSSSFHLTFDAGTLCVEPNLTPDWRTDWAVKVKVQQSFIFVLVKIIIWQTRVMSECKPSVTDFTASG